MADTNKDTIYIDVDDDITGIIEKVRGSSNKIVALVLPKRANALNSIVNMRLLKRTAKDNKKNIVLITSEAGLLPIAGAVGVHVAKTLQSKPAIPPPPEVKSDQEAVVDETNADEVDKSKSVGELAGTTAVAATTDDVIDVDNTLDDIDIEPKPAKKDGKIKIPNFDKFRLKLFLAAGILILLIIGWIFAFKVWPSAEVIVKTNSVSVNSEFQFTASEDATELDEDKRIVPAVIKEHQDTDTQKVATTGEKNIGEKAEGTVSLQNCSNTAGSITIPAGTTVNTGSLSYVTNSSVTLPQSIFAGGSGNCLTATKDADVTARNPGTSGNISSGKQFAVSGYGGVNGTNDSAFSGGTDKTISVVSQKDIDNAKKQILDNTDAAQTALTEDFNDEELFALAATLLPGKQTVSSSVKVGEEATEVEVTVQTNFTMLGVKRDNLKKLIEINIKDTIDISQQALSDDGLDAAEFKIIDKKSDGEQVITVQTTATAGAQIDTEGLKPQLAGKKEGDVKQLVEAMPNVESVNVSFSPFWVHKVPGNTSKVNIVVENIQAESADDQDPQ